MVEQSTHNLKIEGLNLASGTEKLRKWQTFGENTIKLSVCFGQGILTEGEGSVKLTSSLS